MMKQVAIQNCRTGQFFTESKAWANDIGQARQFASSRDALMYALQERLADVQVVLRFGDASSDIVLPITDGCRGTDDPGVAA